MGETMVKYIFPGGDSSKAIDIFSNGLSRMFLTELLENISVLLSIYFKSKQQTLMVRKEKIKNLNVRVKS